MSLSVAVARGAGEASATPPAVGDRAADFQLTSNDGRQVSLAQLNATAPVVLVVLRGYPGYQCPICSVQVGGLIKRAADFDRAGAKVVLVYPGPDAQLDERARQFLGSKSLPPNFVLLTDPGYKFTQAYGLRWEAPRETAYPSTFVIDRGGTIRMAKISHTHGDRSNVADILAALSAK